MADQRTDAPPLQAAEAPVSLATQRRGRADPFAHGALPMRPGEPACCQADVSRLAGWGWAPRYTLEAGIRDLIERDPST